MKKVHNQQKRVTLQYVCGTCGTQFSECYNALRHMRTQHKVTKPYKCQRCPIFFAEEADLKNHEHEDHKQTTAEIEEGKQSVEKMEKSHAFNKFFKTYRIHSHI